jgi:exodeoxyribonuclease VII large subunit
VARAIYNSTIPVVSAVGHEVDLCIADLVADLRAPTPSAAAELLSPDREQLSLQLHNTSLRLQRQLLQRIQTHKIQLLGLSKRLRHPGRRLQDQAQHLDRLEIRLQRAIQTVIRNASNRLDRQQSRFKQSCPSLRIKYDRERIDNLQKRLGQQQQQSLQRSRLRLSAAAHSLHAVSPLATLNRGYAIVTDDADRILHRADSVQAGDRIKARLAEGELECQVTHVYTSSSGS